MSILKPHLVITMNLGRHLQSLGEMESPGKEGSAEVYWLRSGGHGALMVNIRHFAAWSGVGDIEDYYIRVCAAVRKHLPKVQETTMA
ncbi:hypothetical protein [Prosthecobacter sp.]|uniref:hypothetical protein n=1 Tax=Prosthecobacter sp. TaxID=1965333 RepID=UPI003783DC4D